MTSGENFGLAVKVLNEMTAHLFWSASFKPTKESSSYNLHGTTTKFVWIKDFFFSFSKKEPIEGGSSSSHYEKAQAAHRGVCQRGTCVMEDCLTMMGEPSRLSSGPDSTRFVPIPTTMQLLRKGPCTLPNATSMTRLKDGVRRIKDHK